MTNPIEPYAALVRHYRERWEAWGRDPADAVVGAGSAGFFVAPTTRAALAQWRPVFEAGLARQRAMGLDPVFPTLEDAVARSSALVGSPEQVIDKIQRYHEQLGHTILHLTADHDGLTAAQYRAALELFQSDVAPELRRTIPAPPWPTDREPAAANAAVG